uniref:VGF nerve growth factor inducible n=1 Tax=Denticeps clupeoides TaxID=299321 RepID=A0AAY4AG00_9TELE
MESGLRQWAALTRGSRGQRRADIKAGGAGRGAENISGAPSGLPGSSGSGSGGSSERESARKVAEHGAPRAPGTPLSPRFYLTRTVMIRCQLATSAPTTFLLILFSLSVESTSSVPVSPERQTVGNHNGLSSPELSRPLPTVTEEAQQGLQNKKQEEEEDELFKDVDPKTLAAILLDALNKPQGVKKSAGGGEDGVEGKGADSDRERREELELMMAAAAAKGREEREREEEEEKKKEEEEEERLTEKVTSRTTSQTVPVKEQPVVEEQKDAKQEAEPETREEEGEEEQLSPDEVKNLQTMLEQLQSLSTATKRERADSTGPRESRGFLEESDDYLDNEIKPTFRGYNLALSKKKMKWQKEQEKEKSRPLYRGGNFMDDFNDNLTDQPENEEEQDDDDEEEQEEAQSPEEEEARAKAEQEEVRRQAAEAQRAKAEEEKLADIASDMLLQYMGKQDNKNSKKNSLGMNAAEDKRSDEEEDADDDDIDPQTIDKLIEISSKLHLPADDVVDIISDVEKKKKKDAPETFSWQLPLVPPVAPAPVTPVSRNPPPIKSPPMSSPFKSWFKDKGAVKPSKQEFWLKPQRQPFRPYPSYPFYQNPTGATTPFTSPRPIPNRASTPNPPTPSTSCWATRWTTTSTSRPSAGTVPGPSPVCAPPPPCGGTSTSPTTWSLSPGRSPPCPCPSRARLRVAGRPSTIRPQRL